MSNAANPKDTRVTSTEEKPYGNSASAWHQISSRSSERDSLGGPGRSKKSQQVSQDAPAVGHPHKSEAPTYDPRLPKGAGNYAEETRSSVRGSSTSVDSGQHQKSAPSHGFRIPAGKSVTEGQGSNYPHNRITRMSGDGAVTERTVMDKPEVRKIQMSGNNYVSSRTKNSWGIDAK